MIAMRGTPVLSAAVLFLGGLVGQPRNFPQPPPFKDVTIQAIPGVIAAGVKWTQVWQGNETADGMAGTRHDPNQELVGQGLANLATPWVGGATL